MTIEMPKSITLDGKEYPISQFSETIQRLVGIHTEWRTDLVKERLAVAKTEAAIRAVDAELAGLINEEINTEQVDEQKYSSEEINQPEVNS
jgi:hypothetical protein